MNTVSDTVHQPDYSFPTYDLFYDSCKPQIFSFPKSIMEYLWMNPKSPKGYQKLIQTCKIAFLKNPIIVTKSLTNSETDKLKIAIDDSKTKIVNINNFINKFWVTDSLKVQSEGQINCIISMIFKCDVKDLTIYDQNLTFDQFKFLGKNVQTCMLFHAFIKYGDGSDVSFVERFKLLPKIEKLYSYCFNSIVLPDTVEGIIEVPHFKNIKELLIEDVPESFNVEKLNDFLKRNHIYAQITLRFVINQQNFSQGYIKRLQNFIDKIIETRETLSFVPTQMRFNEMQSTVKYHRICSKIYNSHYGIVQNSRFA